MALENVKINISAIQFCIWFFLGFALKDFSYKPYSLFQQYVIWKSVAVLLDKSQRYPEPSYEY